METSPVRRKRALTSEGARAVRQRGHDDALEFALAIGLPRDYANDPHAKKDVIDWQVPHISATMSLLAGL